QDVITGDRDDVTALPLVRAVREAAEPDLRPLQVGEDRDGPIGLVRRGPDQLEHPAVVLVVAVAEVQPGHVHARLDEPAHALRGGGGGTHGAYDLGAPCHCHQASLSPPWGFVWLLGVASTP